MDKFRHLLVFKRRRLSLLSGRKGQAPSVMPHDPVNQESVCCRRLGNFEDFIPSSKSGQSQPGQMPETRGFQDGNGSANIIVGVLPGSIGSVQGLFTSTLE